MAVKKQAGVKGQIVNRTGLSDVFGVALNTIDSWVRQGCPVVQRGAGRGQEWQFNTAAVAQWLRDKSVAEATGETHADEAEITRRTKMAVMLKAELELAKAKGEVAPISEMERVWAAQDAATRANIMNVPGRAVLQLLGCTDETEFKTKLRAELVLALETAAEAELELDEEDLTDG